MMFHRDCIFLKYTGTPNWRNIQRQKQENFCSFTCDSFDEDVLKASIVWLDPIKVRDKIITSERKTISFFIFKQNKVICLFGGSESQVAYTISRILNLFSISLEKVNIFETYKENFLKSINYKGFSLTSFDYAIIQSNLDDSTYINISIDDIEKNNLEKYINSPEVISFTIFFIEKQIYFSLDLNSVASFFDTDEYESIYKVCKRIVVDIV